MSYQSLYRKYRPKTFEDVIGQNHITGTLTNQIKSGRVSHAYLFTGSRGTGKTSCAKIFAKAVNCETPKNGSPCGGCATCAALDDPGNIDILEIDAASNNKVDEIREIREKVIYTPVKGKYKVYIVDEVHMLTDSAFNALLKTLEEPPAHVIFILATTEAHKLPATILSRCMRFDFHLVATEELFGHLKKIYDKEKKKYEEEAVRYIAEAAEGSVRDSLSIADTCLNYSEGVLTYAAVLEVLGAADRSKIRALFLSVAGADAGGALMEIDVLARLGKSMSLIAKEVARYARDLLVLKTAGETLVTDTKENIAKMKREAANYSADLLVSVIQIFSAIDADLRYALSPKIILETAAVRACRLQSSDLSAIAERIRRLEENVVAGAAVRQPAPKTEQIKDTEESKPLDPKSIWGRVTTYFRSKGAMGLYTLTGAHSNVDIRADKFIIRAEDEKFLQFSDEKVIDEINRALIADKVNLTVSIEKITGGTDMDNEIDHIKKLIGSAKLNISK